MKYKFKDGKLMRTADETKYFSASCNLSFTGSSSEDVTEQLLKYLNESVKSGDLSPWFIIEE